MEKEKILFTALTTEELSGLMEKSVRNVMGDYDIRMPETDQLLNARQAAKLINYRRPTLYGLVRQNKIPYSKMAGKLLFSRKKLLDWVENKHAPSKENPPPA
ncbi:helix-turn-helix domain-containing protein [Pedobacter sp. L105]|uniref:helix-turn-helix domain-containing protein n=1 Tax=Pedobacter sp. L105 TaxID=1641871 RepID=UPI00131E1EFA|nr:helix-turn-helix domain-containing protein [Pedobacter sp. L105]